MKLTTIALRNFRSSRALVLKTDTPRLLVCGANGAGKSSIRDSVKWTLRGLCAGTDAKGSGWEALVPTGTTTLAAGLHIHSLGTVERSYKNGTRQLQVEDVIGESSLHQAALYLKLKTSPACLDAVLDTGHFLNLSHVEAKALVLGLLDVRIPIGEESLTLDALDAKYHMAFEDRKAAKIRAKSAVVPAKPDTEPLPTIAAISAQLTKIRAELSALQTGAGVTAGKRAVLEQRLTTARRLETVPVIDEAHLLELEERVAIMEEELEERGRQETVDASIPPENDSPEDAASLTHRILQLTQHKPTGGCVLDHGVPCETAKVKFTLRAKALKTQVESLPAPTRLQKPAEPRQTPLQAIRQELAKAQALKAAALAVEAWNAARRQEELALMKELAALPETTDAFAESDILADRIRKGELLLTRARAYWQAVEHYEAAVQAKAKLQGDVDRLEALCELLGPNGARVEALHAKLGPFEAQVNGVTDTFGWHVAFVLDPWQVVVNERPVETYSESEQFRIGIALQLAVASLSGLSFAIVDRLDMLDHANRKIVTAMLMEAPLEQIIILATREPDQPLPNMPGVIAYRLAKADSGETIVVEQTWG